MTFLLTIVGEKQLKKSNAIAMAVSMGVSLMSTLPSPLFAEAAGNGVEITKENFIHADSTRAYFKELDKAGKVNVIRPERELITADTRCH